MIKFILNLLVIFRIFNLASCTLKESPNLSKLQVNFTFEDKHKCSTSPPSFIIKGIPEGTKTLRFVMIDLDKPSYNHGGGDVVYDGSEEIPEGSFSYKGPCPPSRHTYKFIVKATLMKKVILY